MKAVIAVPFFDTPENDRAERITMKVMSYLRSYTQQGHIVIPINNGSTDQRAADYAWNNFRYFMEFKEPKSISQAVNAAWSRYHKDLIAGRMFAVKHDADVMVLDDPHCRWLEDIAQLFRLHPRVYLAGPRFERQEYTGDWIIQHHARWLRTKFIYGGVQVRSPRGFRAIGYARQPYGRWGWGDHWDSFRAKYAGGWLAVLKDYAFREMEKGGGALTDEERKAHKKRGHIQFTKMQQQIRKGERTIWEDAE